MSNVLSSKRRTRVTRETLIHMLETLPGALFFIDNAETVLYANASTQALTGARPEEVIGQPLSHTLWESDSPTSHERLRAALAQASGGETVRFEARIHTREGRYLDVAATITPHGDPDNCEYLIYAATDVPAHKQAEEGLIDAIPQLVWTGRPDGYVDYHNQRWCDYTNLTTEQCQKDDWVQCLSPDEQPHLLTLWQSAIQTGRPYEAELRLRQGTTGDYRWFLMQTTPFRDAQGTILKHVGTCTDIEEQKRAEQQLKASEQNWRVLAETVPQQVWTTLPDGQPEYVNQRWRDYTGFTPEQLQSDRWAYLQIIHPDDRDGNRACWQHALDTGEMFEIEHRLKNGQTGAYRWFLTRALPVRDDTGQILKWFGTDTDIHEKKQAEDDMRVLVEAIPQLVWITRPDGFCEYCSQQWCDYTQMTLAQMQGEGWVHCLHPDDRQPVLERWRRAVQTGEPYEVEFRCRNGRSGEYRWFLTRGRPHKNAQGRILKWFGTCTDIEDQKRTEEALRESREDLAVLMETMPQLVWIARPDGFLEQCNQRSVAYLNVPIEQFKGDQWLQFVHPEDQDKARTIWQTALHTGQSHEVEYRMREGKTGSYRWLLVRGTPFKDEQGRILKWFGTCTDIEDQKRTEEALRQSQERIRALLDSNIIGIVSNEGEEEVIVEANEAFLQMSGYTQEEVDSRTLTRKRIAVPEDAQLFERALQEVAACGQHTPFETEMVCKDGSRLPILVGGVLFQDHPHQLVSFVLDNSARKELEQRKDDFISMASHELRNPLAALKLQSSLLHRQLAKQGIQALDLSSMETQLNKVSRLVKELLDVSKIQAGGLEYIRETVDIDELLREITNLMQHIHPSHTILVHGAVQTSLMGDRDRLGQVFTNLISNAIKYSPHAETVEIDLSASPEMVTVRVRDHGLGIPREQRDKIFERFYRAAEPKQRAIPGLGMGLYIVAEIVKYHRGTITVGSAVGEGSTFTVTLPLKQEV